MTVLSFTLMVNQFYLTRGFRLIEGKGRMSYIVKAHRLFGYISVGFLLFHPLLEVLPRQFEGSIQPFDAFWKIITTDNSAILLGIAGWAVMLTLAVTSVLRKRLFKNYRKWRTFHGILAVVLITVVGYHGLVLGRHSSLAMKAFYAVLLAGGYVTMIKTYVFDLRREEKWKNRGLKLAEDSSSP